MKGTQVVDVGNTDRDAAGTPREGRRGEGAVDRTGADNLLMLRSEELFDRGKGKVHEVDCLQRRDVAF